MYLKKSFKFPKKKVFVIAEVGFNHEGNLQKCIDLVSSAWKSGADAVKIQIFNSDLNYAKKSDSYKLISSVSLTKNDLEKVFTFARKKKIPLFCSFGDFDSLNFIRKYHPFCYKISSSTLTHIPLIKEICRDKTHLVISTGMAVDKDIENTLQIIKKNKLIKKTMLLHCVSLYPTPYKHANLSYINSLKKKFNLPIGYSDHCLGMEACLSAVSMGAEAIEKHFTFDSNRQGVDHKWSLDAKNFEIMVKKIRRIEEMRGANKPNNKKIILPVRKKFSRYLVAQKEIKEGELFTMKNVGFKRPYGKKVGMDPSYLYKILNKKNPKELKPDQVIDLNHFKKFTRFYK